MNLIETEMKVLALETKVARLQKKYANADEAVQIYHKRWRDEERLRLTAETTQAKLQQQFNALEQIWRDRKTFEEDCHRAIRDDRDDAESWDDYQQWYDSQRNDEGNEPTQEWYERSDEFFGTLFECPVAGYQKDEGKEA